MTESPRPEDPRVEEQPGAAAERGAIERSGASGARAGPRRDWLTSPALLVVAVVLVYAGSLGGGWLGYDDDWLARDNELLNDGSGAVLGRILFGLDRDTRLVLGAEYLPVRDLVTWLARGVLGLDATGLRIVCLLIYAGACAALLRWSEAMPSRGYVIAVWLFALHPVHAESVAWIAGLKDVLALAFLALALALYAGAAPTGARRVAIVLAVALACMSKAVAVVAPALLLASDVALSRRPERTTLLLASAVALGFATVHAWIGGLVGMYAEPLGATFVERVGSQAVIIVRYLALSFCVHPQSLAYEVDVHGLDGAAAASSLLVVAGCAAIMIAGRRGARWPLAAALVFVAGLAPVLATPLQNRMADRYLLLAVLGPMLVAGHALEAALARTRDALAPPLLALSFIALALVSGLRALTLADPIAAFEEATERTQRDARVAILLGNALLADGRTAEAEAAYRVAIDRDGLRTNRGRIAANELGRLLAARGELEEARAVYATLVERYPEHPRALYNLSIVEQRLGDLAAAEAHRGELVRRFPTFRPGQDRPGPL